MHRNARLTPAGRLLLCQRIEAGWPVAHAAASMGISRDRAYVWWRRYQAEGVAGLEDRSSRPHRVPHRTKPSRGAADRAAAPHAGPGPGTDRRDRRQCPASTVHAVLVRHGLNRLDHLDRLDPGTDPPDRDDPARRAGPRRHQEARPDPQRRRLAGPRPRSATATIAATTVGYAFVHSAVDAYSRLAYSEVLDDEQGATAAAFWGRAEAFFAAHGITIERVLTDNGSCYRSRTFSRGARRRHPHPHPALPARDQRQGRTVQPHPPRRMGLRPTLELRRPTHPRLDRLAPPLQPSPTPHRHRRPTHHPCQQPARALQVWVGAARLRYSERPKRLEQCNTGGSRAFRTALSGHPTRRVGTEPSWH